LDEPLGAEEVENPVDARDPDPPVGCPQPVEDLLRREAAVLLGEQVDHDPTCAAIPKALPTKRLGRRCTPVLAHRRHTMMIAILTTLPRSDTPIY